MINQERNSRSSQPTEVQINFLKATDPLVKSNVNHPLSFRTEKELTQNQKIAIQSGIMDVTQTIIEALENTSDLEEQEQGLVITTAINFVLEKGTPISWLLLKRIDSFKAGELHPFINELIKVFKELKNKGIALEEYLSINPSLEIK